MFDDIVEKNNALADYENNKLTEVKQRDFSAKAIVHDFSQKLAILLSFYSRQDGPGECVSRYFKKKKLLSRL